MRPSFFLLLRSSIRPRAFPARLPALQPLTRRYQHTNLDMANLAVNKNAHVWDRTRLETMLNRRFFYAPAFEIYGGVAGLYDYGPPGAALQANIISEWRRHFIVEENMLELDPTIMTPAPVFETSGHVARFADWMVKDTKTGEVLRADHLVKNVLEARLAGDKEARGLATQPPKEDDKKKKKKKDAKAVPVQLADELVAEYDRILAQVRLDLLFIRHAASPWN
jgi:glycyl-tRNA synthetase